MIELTRDMRRVLDALVRQIEEDRRTIEEAYLPMCAKALGVSAETHTFDMDRMAFVERHDGPG